MRHGAPERLPSDGPGAPNYGGDGRPPAAEVGAEHDLGIEERDQRPEVALAGGGEEGIDDRSLLDIPQVWGEQDRIYEQIM
jgi:hypothetical protein